jgi:hypothetical protein
VPDVAYCCAACATKLGKALHAAAGLVPELETAVARLARFGEPGPRSRGRAPAQPIRPDQPDADQSGPDGLPISWSASIAAGTVANTVSTWCRVVVDERYGGHGQAASLPGEAITGLPREAVGGAKVALGDIRSNRIQPPVGPICLECDHPSCERLHDWRRWMPPPTTLVETMRWLAGQLDWARYQRWAAECWDELGHAAGLVERAVDRPAVRTRIAVGPCPEIVAGGVACAGEVVAIVPARETRPAFMRCQLCGTEWPTMQWARAGRRILAQKNREAA